MVKSKCFVLRKVVDCVAHCKSDENPTKGVMIINTNRTIFDIGDNSSRVEFELPMLEVGVRVPVVAKVNIN